MQGTHDFARRLKLLIEPFGTSKCFVDEYLGQAVGLVPKISVLCYKPLFRYTHHLMRNDGPLIIRRRNLQGRPLGLRKLLQQRSDVRELSDLDILLREQSTFDREVRDIETVLRRWCDDPFFRYRVLLTFALVCDYFLPGGRHDLEVMRSRWELEGEISG